MHGETVQLNTTETPSLPENLFLFDERNRAFLEYRSTLVYPYKSLVHERIQKVILLILVIGLAYLLTYLLFNIIRSALSAHTNPVELVLAVTLTIGLVVALVLGARAYLRMLGTKRQDREILVREGKIIFVPIEKCTLIRYWRAPPPIMRLKCTFVSPRSGRTMTRSFAAGWPLDGSCLAVGTPIALLFQNYANFQVL